MIEGVPDIVLDQVDDDPDMSTKLLASVEDPAGEFYLLSQSDGNVGGQALVKVVGDLGRRVATGTTIFPLDDVQDVPPEVADALASATAEGTAKEERQPYAAAALRSLDPRELDAKVLAAAMQADGRLNTDVPGTDHGNLACAWAVNEIVRQALGRPIGGGLSTDAMFAVLHRDHSEVAEARITGGCIVISPTVGKKRHGHVGIIGTVNAGAIGSTRIYSNHSATHLFGHTFTIDSWKAYFTRKTLQVHYFRLDPARFVAARGRPKPARAPRFAMVADAATPASVTVRSSSAEGDTYVVTIEKSAADRGMLVVKSWPAGADTQTDPPANDQKVDITDIRVNAKGDTLTAIGHAFGASPNLTCTLIGRRATASALVRIEIVNTPLGLFDTTKELPVDDDDFARLSRFVADAHFPAAARLHAAVSGTLAGEPQGVHEPDDGVPMGDAGVRADEETGADDETGEDDEESAAAVRLSNFGADGAGVDGDDRAPPYRGLSTAAKPQLAIDINRALAFLHACETSTPRVRYGLGAKVPSLTAVPGRDFKRVDCSGFVRAAIQRSTTPPARFPDGSVIQHQFVATRGFETATVADGARSDGAVRIAFLAPHQSPSGIGHVVLLHNGKTLESHGGVGPDSRPWTATGWQAQTSVFVLERPGAGVAHPLMFSFDHGQLPTIACMNVAHTPLGVDWTALLAALDEYANKIFSAVWGTPCKIVDAKNGPLPAGCWGMVFSDDADQADALGYHDLTPDGLPLSKVFVRTTIDNGDKVSVTASHELAEMLVDPGVQLGALGADRTTWYAYETADAVEREDFEVQGIAMSNFVYPSWFESFRAPRSTRFDHNGTCERPFEIRPGGYMPVFQQGGWTQIFGSEAARASFDPAAHPRNGGRGQSMRHRTSASPVPVRRHAEAAPAPAFAAGLTLPSRETTPPAETLYVKIDLGVVGRRPETGIFIPPNFQAAPAVDVVLYLHGHDILDGVDSIDKYFKASYGKLREGVTASGRHVILVAPTLGPGSEAGNLAKPGGLDAYLAKVLTAIRANGQTPGLANVASVGNLVIACHSGGGARMREIAGGRDTALANLRECWGFDCLYSPLDVTFWTQWVDHRPSSRLLLFYLENGTMVAHRCKALADLHRSNLISRPSTTSDHMLVPTTHWVACLNGARLPDAEPG